MNYGTLTIKPKVFGTIFALCLLAMFFFNGYFSMDTYRYLYKKFST